MAPLQTVFAAPADAMVLFGDIGQIQKMSERPRQRNRLRYAEPMQKLPELVRRLKIPAARLLGELTDPLDLIKKPLPLGLAQHLAEQGPEPANIGAEARGRVLDRCHLILP